MSTLGTRVASRLTCRDCGRNLHSCGPYIGAITEHAENLYSFLCSPCAERNVDR